VLKVLTSKQTLAIKKKLLDMNTTVKDLASDWGVSRTFLSGIINGSRNDARLEEKLKQEILGRK
jgi:hypothetical protein